MRYKTYICTHEWKIIAETFEFKKLNRSVYDQKRRSNLCKEAWNGNIPLYLHDVGILSPEYLIKISKDVVTSELIFTIFDKQNITFEEMIKEIWERRKDIIKIIARDEEENPYNL